MSLGLAHLSARLSKVPLHRFQGRVTQVIGNVIEAELPALHRIGLRPDPTD